MVGETLRIDGCRGNYHLEIRALRQEPFEVAEEEIDIQATLVGFVDDDGVISVELRIALQFR